MASFSFTSSSAIACASFHAATTRSESFTGASFSRMRPMAQARLTAVGRVTRSLFEASEMEASEGSRETASAMPYAAATPINGAPRTRIDLMACAISSTERIAAVSKTCGSLAWSMMWTTPCDSSAQIER